ncbi:PREDICTED: peptidyl-tRNA hydrolase 2, mitochondrial-like isoform X2 [Dinoponera quadriceps]|nr:PREDICTED: peptidyl-tRNA hydrolase 2, mitochondrial-like isoform X2 [Dinoponera quadriceps]
MMKALGEAVARDSKVTFAQFALAFTCGFLINTILRNTVLGRKSILRRIIPGQNSQSEDWEDSDDDEDDEDDNDNEDECFDSYMNNSKSEPYKMVLAINNKLKMEKGKVAAQCAHGAIAAYKIALTRNPSALKRWEKSGQTKITVKVDDEYVLADILRKAKEAHLISHIIQDAGRTQIQVGSKTVCVIGPGPSKLIDKITGEFKLY